MGLLTGAVTAQTILRTGTPRDFDQSWFAARAVLSGVDPYDVIGPGRAFEWPFGFLYPLPAALAAIPLAHFSAAAAGIIFSVVAGAAFAWALLEHGYGPLFGFLGMPLHAAAEAVQWSPLLSGALAATPLAVFWVAKPTVGAAMFAARPTRWALGGGIVLCGLSFALQPTWLSDWMGAIARNNAQWAPTVPYRAPVTFPGGVLALLCLARWRRPEARLVAVLACVPQTLVLYEAVPLFLVPRTFWQSATLVVLSYGAHFWVRAHLPPSYHESLNYHLTGQALVLALYLPVTIMVLRRPNEGPAPSWLDRRLAPLPGWLRGRVARAAA